VRERWRRVVGNVVTWWPRNIVIGANSDDDGGYSEREGWGWLHGVREANEQRSNLTFDFFQPRHPDACWEKRLQADLVCVFE